MLLPGGPAPYPKAYVPLLAPLLPIPGQTPEPIADCSPKKNGEVTSHNFYNVNVASCLQ